MEANVLSIGSHIAVLADDDFVKDLLNELTELLAGTEIVVEAVKTLVELALEEGPNALNAVEGRSYRENNDEIIDADELTIGRLELGNETVLNQSLFNRISVVSAMVVED